jgi:hypothetical protein
MDGLAVGIQRHPHSRRGKDLLGLRGSRAAVLKCRFASLAAAAVVAIPRIPGSIIASTGLLAALVTTRWSVVSTFVWLSSGFKDLRGATGTRPSGPEEKFGQQTGVGIRFGIAHGGECSN